MIRLLGIATIVMCIWIWILAMFPSRVTKTLCWLLTALVVLGVALIFILQFGGTIVL